VHPRLKDALRRCLEKHPKRRWQAIGDLRVEIEQILANPVAVAAPSPAVPARSSLLAMLPYVAAAAIVSGAAVWFLKPATPRQAPAIVRFDVDVPTQTQPLRGLGRPLIALSRDGRFVAYNTVGGVRLRSMDTLTSRVIPGTEMPVTSIFFSPDGNWLGYWSAGAGTLQKISVSGGAPVTIAPAMNPFGVSWGFDDNLLFAQVDGIWRVAAGGGTPQRVIPIKESAAVDLPSLLPDGKTILYSLTRAQGANRWDQGEIIAQRPGGQPKVLVRGGSAATYVPTGHLLYAVGNVLYAIAFDAAALATSGGPVPVVNGVQRAVAPDVNSSSANYGVSDGGSLAYLNEVPGTTAQQNTLGIVDRTGAVRSLDVPRAEYRNPRVSPDGRQIAVETAADDGRSVIWVYDLSGSSAIRRLTQDGNNTRPVWTPDSKRIAFGSDRQKPYGIYWQPADGSGLPERLTTAEDGYLQYPESFSPDGKVLSFARVKPPLGQSSWGLYTVPLDSGDRKPQLFYDLPNSNEFGSQFSPDGKWIAYASNAVADQQADPSALTGFAIYVQPYPPTGVKYQITQTGGAWPIWSSNGRELLYRLQGTSATGTTPKIYSVSITTQPTPVFTAEHPLPIQGFQPVINYREYDVLPNGRGLVMVLAATAGGTTASASAHISTVLNWVEELKTRVPTKPR
jgi:Tol biopolymer transport system component